MRDEARTIIVRTAGTTPDIVVKGIVSAEIKRQRQEMQMVTDVLVKRNIALNEEVEQLQWRLEHERKHLLNHRINEMIERMLSILYSPWAVWLEMKELYQRKVLRMDDYDLGYSRPRRRNVSNVG